MKHYLGMFIINKNGIYIFLIDKFVLDNYNIKD